ncbi:hypothetical protein AURDEDRAFT_178631 [Auricularia subglabra TFB-10046 SS5]|uniref:Uncharacterized protein n=1 Tax=Auricularia subglabra (strain TFB-10046 / SS5) TaxID=717982 RepID=J0WKM7_AURST|nr:hypothetical protein AURDEDRAFT_178631 [Auricularia subglabra TFB-10046 SS5]
MADVNETADITPTVDALGRLDIVLHMATVALTFHSLHSLSLVNRATRAAALATHAHLLSPTRFFHQLFGNPTQLVELLSTGHMLVTGTPVLQYLADFVPIIAGLTFIVNPPLVARLTAYLLSQGYSLEYDSDDTDEFDMYGTDFNSNPVIQTLAFCQPDADDWIYVHVPRITPLHVLLMQSSSLLFNGICSSGFFSLYPRVTLLQRVGFLARRFRGGGFMQCQIELARVGFVALDSVRYGREHNTLLRGPRFVGDQWTWLPYRSMRGAAYGQVLGQGWTVCEQVRLLDSHRGYVVNTYVAAFPVSSPLLGRTFLATSLTKFYLTRLLLDAHAAAALTTASYVAAAGRPPCVAARPGPVASADVRRRSEGSLGLAPERLVAFISDVHLQVGHSMAGN